MKNRMKIIFSVLLFVFVLTTFNCKSQVVVKEIPKKPKTVFAKPPKPGLDYFWVKPYWHWSSKSNRYIWTQGYWKKRIKNTVYIPGHWINTSKGYKWEQGALENK